MVVAFGSLFNEITLIRYNNNMTQEYERIKVPLIYSPKEKFISRLFSDPDLVRSVNTILPRMGFEVTGYTYDSSRKPITTLKNFSQSTSKNTVKTQNVGVPYDMDFTLSIYVRNIEDGTQIVEQILPYFTPDFTITINFIDGFAETTKDVPFILNSVDNTIEYEGDFTTTRLIIWNLNFTAKTFFFGPITDGAKIIAGQAHANGDPILDATGVAMGGVKIGLYNEIFNRQIQDIVMKEPGHGNFKENETIRVANTNIIGKVHSWTANTYTLTAKNWTGVVGANNVIKGDESNASWTVDDIEGTYIKIASVVTVQDPLSAGANDDYGFTTTITEYPNA
jgi:hypothetical protein